MTSLPKNLPFNLLPPSMRGEVELFLTVGRTPKSAFVRALLQNDLQKAISLATTQERADLLSAVLWFKAYTPGLPFSIPSALNTSLYTVHLDMDVELDAGHFTIPVRLSGTYEKPVRASNGNPPEGAIFEARVVEWKLPGSLDWTPVPDGFFPPRILGAMSDEAAGIIQEEYEAGGQGYA
jgi:hypothetical protein